MYCANRGEKEKRDVDFALNMFGENRELAIDDFASIMRSQMRIAALK